MQRAVVMMIRMGELSWPAEAVDIMRGDVVAAFAATTRYGSASVAPVCPLGMIDVEARTIGTSVPLAFSDKLRRLAEAPQSAISFFRRDHGLSDQPGFVLAQGEVTFPDTVPIEHREQLAELALPYLGPFQIGRLLRALGGAAYYEQRIPVTLHVTRLRYWSDPTANGEPVLVGSGAPTLPVPPQHPPKGGGAPVILAAKLAKQLRRGNDHLLGWIDSDGLPTMVPVEPRVDGERLRIDRAGLPPGGRRAALLGFWYNAKLHGQGALMARGWMESDETGATLAVSTCRKFNSPPGKLVQTKVLPVGVGFMHRKAVRSGAVRGDTFIRAG